MMFFIHVSGLPCSGKTAFRHRLAGSGVNVDVSLDIEDVWHQVIAKPSFTKEESERVFDEYERQIEEAMKNGRSLVGESVLASESRFFRLKQLAQKHQIRPLFVMTEAENKILMTRRAARSALRPETISESALHELATRFATRKHMDLILDTTGAIDAARLKSVRDWINGTPIHS